MVEEVEEGGLGALAPAVAWGEGEAIWGEGGFGEGVWLWKHGSRCERFLFLFLF